MSTTEPPKTLEQILSQYAVSIVESSDSSGLDRSEALAEIQALIEAVIGEDEDLYFGKPHGFNDNFSFNDSANIRNKFRAEQRLRLSKLSRHHPAKGDKSDA